MQQIKQKSKSRPLQEDFRKAQRNESSIGVMKHKDGTIETRQFNREANHG